MVIFTGVGGSFRFSPKTFCSSAPSDEVRGCRECTDCAYESELNLYDEDELDEAWRDKVLDGDCLIGGGGVRVLLDDCEGLDERCTGDGDFERDRDRFFRGDGDLCL